MNSSQNISQSKGRFLKQLYDSRAETTVVYSAKGDYMRGRKQKPYQTSWGEILPGLYREVDGRWRILATGKKFTEHDERLAVARFKAANPSETVFLSVAKSMDPADIAAAGDKLAPDTDQLQIIEHENGEEEIGYHLDSQTVWDWLRNQIIERPSYVAGRTGIPQLATFASLPIPQASMQLASVLKLYSEFSEATIKTKREVVATFELLIKHTSAKTLDDLTAEKLREFRQWANKELAPSTAALYFSRIRTVLSTAAIKGGGNIEQLEAARTRAKLLCAQKRDHNDDPRPVSRADFHKLLGATVETNTPEVWTAMLYMGLNAALYMEDLCDLKWESLDLDKKTYVGRRKKKGNCLRVAVLWDETVRALKALPKRGSSPYVFCSPHGTRYNRNTKTNDFADALRKKAGLGTDIKWSHLRDGSYTAACNAQGVDEKFARLLAGHKAPGLQDKYVLRNPHCVKGACDAVYAAYLGPVAAMKICAA